MEHMEVEVYWFWIIYTIPIITIVFLVYFGTKSVSRHNAEKRYDQKSKYWSHYWTAGLILAVIASYSPIKLKTNTVKIQKQYTQTVERNLGELPPRETDDSFEKSVNSVKSITKETIWEK